MKFNKGCRNCTFRIDKSKLTEADKKLAEFLEEGNAVSLACVVCQARVIKALNGDGSNSIQLARMGWVPLEE